MKRWIRWIVVIAVLAGLGLGVARAIKARRAQQEAVAQQAAQRAEAPLELAASDVVPLRTLSLAQGLALSGTLKAANVVQLKAKVAGELQGFSLREGDPVKAGQVVGRIDPVDATARVRQAEQQAEWSKAQVEMAQRSYDNNKAMVSQGFISQTALDTSTSSLAAAQANLRAAQAAVDVAAKVLQDTTLRAPITGQVSARLAQNGERLALDARVVEIVDLSRMELEASLSAADSMAVRVGQLAELRIEGAARPVAARVVRINPSLVAGSRAVLAYLETEPLPGLRQGMFAQGTLRTGEASAPALPLDAVRTDKPEPYVQLVRDNRVVHQRVETGERGMVEGRSMVAVRGLPDSATVLVGSVGALREGTPVKLATRP